MHGFKNVNIDITLIQNFSLRIPLVHSIIDPPKKIAFLCVCVLHDSLNSLAQKSGIENPFSGET